MGKGIQRHSALIIGRFVAEQICRDRMAEFVYAHRDHDRQQREYDDLNKLRDGNGTEEKIEQVGKNHG